MLAGHLHITVIFLEVVKALVGGGEETALGLTAVSGGGWRERERA